MLMGTTLGAMALAAAIQADTTFAVDPNLRLEVVNNSGEIFVRTWERNEISIRTSYYRRSALRIEHTSTAVRIGARSRYRDEDDDVEFLLTVPASMALELSGAETNVTVDGAGGEVSVDVSEGDVIVLGGAGRVSAQTDEGDIRVEGVTGRIRLFSMDGDITVDGAAGDLEVETTDGIIELVDIRAMTVQANTVDGDIWFDGELFPGGSYTLSTHDGNVTARIPEDADARVTVAVFDGDFSSDFPITVSSWPSGRRVEFTLGAGRAQLEIESFDGEVVLRRRP